MGHCDGSVPPLNHLVRLTTIDQPLHQFHLQLFAISYLRLAGFNAIQATACIETWNSRFNHFAIAKWYHLSVEHSSFSMPYNWNETYLIHQMTKCWKSSKIKYGSHFHFVWKNFNHLTKFVFNFLHFLQIKNFCSNWHRFGSSWYYDIEHNLYLSRFNREPGLNNKICWCWLMAAHQVVRL